MKAFTRSLLPLALLSLLTACGSDGESEPVDFTGSYNIQAISTTGLDINGGTCGDATGTMNIADNQMTGSVLTTNGTALSVQGSVAENGAVTGGFAVGGEALVNFTGTMSGSGGSGDWEDSFECIGTWTAERT